MTEKVLKLLAAMGADTSQEELLTPLCQAVQDSLARRLRPGVTAEDCESAFITAAAWMVLAGLRTGDGGAGVTAFTAGDVTIRREGGRETASLLEQAERLMAPYVVDGGFFVQGVRG